MTEPKIYAVVSLFCGLGGKSLGFLRARGRAGSRFESVGAFDLNPEACADFELLTGAKAQTVDLGALEPQQLADRCLRRPDVVILSPPCKGFSGCLPEATSKTAKYQGLNALALRTIDLVLEAWPVPPAFILLENVPRMKTRGAELLKKITALLRSKGYETDLRTHDCGELGELAQSRERVLLVARHRDLAPTPLLKPDPKPLRSMASVLWQLPVPTPDNCAGGRMHRLSRLSALNWARLAAIRAGNDWRDLPAAIRMGGDPHGRQSGVYGVCSYDGPSHAVVGRARAGNHSWASVADPRLPGDDRRHAGKYGVQDDTAPAHTVISEARTGKGWADVSDPRLAPRAARQNGGFGVNDPGIASHSVVAEGSVRNTWGSVADPRLEYSAREGGSHGVADPERPSVTVLGRPGIANGTAAIADPRSDCTRRDGAMGVNDPGGHLYTSVIANAQIHNGPWQVADPRVTDQYRGAFGVEDPAISSKCIRGRHCVRTAPASIADGRQLFRPTHQLVAGQALSVSRSEWTRGEFWLLGPHLELGKKGRPTHVVIEAPDGTVHRPMTTLELAVLQGLPAWHRPGDPTELALGAEGGQPLELTGGSVGRWRERIGNAVPPPTAQAIAEEVLAILDAGTVISFRLSAGGIWVAPALVSAEAE